MADKGGPELSWQTVIAALTAVGILAAAQWAIFQNQFAGIEKIVTADRILSTDNRTALDKYLSIREHNEYREGMKDQVEDIRRRLTMLEIAMTKMAHDPVESRTFEAVSKATDDRVTLLQNQITDINRQIAAALIIIDNNAAARRTTPTPP